MMLLMICIQRLTTRLLVLNFKELEMTDFTIRKSEMPIFEILDRDGEVVGGGDGIISSLGWDNFFYSHAEAQGVIDHTGKSSGFTIQESSITTFEIYDQNGELVEDDNGDTFFHSRKEAQDVIDAKIDAVKVSINRPKF